MDTPAIRHRLADGLRQLDLQLDAIQIGQLLQYLELLTRWNRAYNLTAVTDPADMVHLHLLDSLAVLPFLRGQRFADVGTGPGLPGIPLAIARPDCHFVLVDSNGKRVRFLFQVRLALGLTNVSEHHARAEAFVPQPPVDGVISRAFTSLSEMLDKTRGMLATGGRFYAMKGRYPEKELSELAKDYTVSACHRLQVPGVDADRHLVDIGLSSAG